MAQVFFHAVARDSEALHRANVDAGIALDAARCRELGLDIAVETALDFARGLFDVEAELHLYVHLLEAAREIHMPHLLARRGIVIVVVAPLADPHLLADEVRALRQALGNRDAVAVIVDRNRGLMSVLGRPDNVLRSPGRVAAEENSLARTLHGFLVHHGHIPLIELDADIAFDPGK